MKYLGAQSDNKDIATKDLIPTAYASNPAMDGTASPGSSSDYSRGDHVHPTDTSRASDAELKTFVRPNLLDNWYFVGGGSQQGGGQFPINQRGQTNYTNGNYTIDRWYTYGSVVVDSDGITVSGSGGEMFLQRIENPQRFANKILCVSAFGHKSVSGGWVLRALVNGSTWIGTGGGLPVATDGCVSECYDLSSYDTITSLSINLVNFQADSVMTLKAVKLELGDTQTLAHQDSNGNWVLNEIPNYTEQLMRCYRYYRKMSVRFFSRSPGSSNQLTLPGVFYPPMRNILTSSNTSLQSYYGTAGMLSNISGNDALTVKTIFTGDYNMLPTITVTAIPSDYVYVGTATLSCDL